ncbi:MAG: queuosine precursor transporter [Parachlamydiales bacterium]|nr:queuosine precursor transporter [Parachlamydiales bacterium]
MNEIFFITHIFLVIIFLLAALKLGKEYLITLLVLQVILANIFIIKQIDLFTKTVTATDVFIVGSIFCQNLIQEFYSKKDAIKAIYISFFMMIFFLVMAKLHLLYTPALTDTTQKSFETLLVKSPRIILSSIFVFFLSQRLDVFLFSFLKKLFKDKKLSLRLFVSSTVTQLFDTILFSFLALYGIVYSILNIILFSFSIKVITIFVSSLFLTATKKIIKQEKHG